MPFPPFDGNGRVPVSCDMSGGVFTIQGRPVRHCDGLRRRSFLKAGALGFGALTLADLLRGEAAAGIRSSNKAIINIHLDGGPPQMDLIDPKPDAPSEIRGEFGPIRTKIPGVHLTELLPRIAAHADKYVFLRALVGADGKHDAFQCQSGFTEKELTSVGGRPAMGCVLNKLLGKSGDTAPVDKFTQLSLGILSSGKFADALDLEKEDRRVLERYTPRIADSGLGETMESPKAALKFLMARRLVEAGVRCVSLSLGDFDTHEANFPRLRYLGPLLDHALDTLVTDLDERGMLDDVMIIVWGEFGRSPKISAKGGREHWPQVSMGLMAGGGLRTGQVIGSTDRHAAEAASRPVHYQDVFAMLYRHLGIDAQSTTLTDTTGRPHLLLDMGRPIEELI
ncbi:MAG: DUF1501 domain-containing protein [Verrucomicrobia bacterium]|nr:DUF1501 domain-containing protein [Verrucomicrobiota bacterium]